jgi:hypothetical protein
MKLVITIKGFQSLMVILQLISFIYNSLTFTPSYPIIIHHNWPLHFIRRINRINYKEAIV